MVFNLYTLPCLAVESVDEPVNGSQNQESLNEADAVFGIRIRNEAEMIRLLRVTQKIVSSPKLYEYLNEIFRDHLTVSSAQSKELGISTRIKGLSETQILFLLKKIKNFKKIESLFMTYVENINQFQLDDPLRDDFIEPLKKEFQSVLADGKVIQELHDLNDPSKTLTVAFTSGKAGFSNASIHFNRPRYVNYKDISNGFVPEENLKQIIIEAIRQAKVSISINIFEFNLIEIAEELERAIQRGVKVRIGVDQNTTRLAQENKDVLIKLIQLHRTHRDLMKLTLVKPTALNHQKLFVFDAGTKSALTIESSGNLTQSCIGPEGDAVKLPPELRPASSKPNANHLLMYRGTLPSLIAEHELNKTLDQRLHGQRGYPISGSYSFFGELFSDFEKRSTLNLAFSPNGGMGDVAASIYRPLILKSKGQVISYNFVESAPSIDQTYLDLARRYPKTFDKKGLYDSPFAMQPWSLPLRWSLMKRDKETLIYSEDKSSPLISIFSDEQIEKLRSQTRLNTRAYGEFHPKVEIDGEKQSIKITVKMHNKIFILPKINLAIVGTSFNPSASAEGNQEQIAWITDHPIVKETMNAFFYDYDRANTTVVKQTERRNKYIKDPLLKLEPIHKETKTRQLEDNALIEDSDIVEDRTVENDLESKQVSRDKEKVSKNKCMRFY